MIIKESSIGMAASRSYSKFSYVKQSVQLIQRDKNSGKDKNDAASVSLTQHSKEISKKLKELNQEKKEGLEKAFHTSKEKGFLDADLEEDVSIQTLRRILESLRMVRGEKLHKPLPVPKENKGTFGANLSPLFSMGSSENQETGGAEWVQQTQGVSYNFEAESSSFSTSGCVKTADGREINFNVDVEMSRSFMEQNEFLYTEKVIMRDPLVINMDNSVTEVQDQKFRFDIDADGEMDEISFLNQGSGFLALDKNNDGVINDGTELFGTKSGNGFKDLAAYDEDKNGWIDEGDSIFKNLKIWSKDREGKDQLVGIGKAGVGAIYLRNLSTEFSLKNETTNQTNAVIRKSGVFLKENGQTGTIQHIDLAL